MITLNNISLRPGKIICVGRNYVKHIEELNNEFPQEMVLFQKSASSISRQLIHPMKSCRFEAEICLLIKNKKVYAIGAGLDLTLDKIQNRLKEKGLPWERAKNFKNAAVFSDFVFFDTQSKLSMKLYKNGKLQQNAKEENMIYSINEILSQSEEVFGLEDNDIIMTGTPEGVDNFIIGDNFRIELYADNELLLRHSWVAITN
ncbi:MAG: 2-keto-4-pentenoate hydratase [Arcobacter sp.]|nr:MAG: 2-keto-4-pentenoate hydratase [Arcobacter sp.]